jgi:hypothetical protein
MGKDKASNKAPTRLGIHANPDRGHTREIRHFAQECGQHRLQNTPPLAWRFTQPAEAMLLITPKAKFLSAEGINKNAVRFRDSQHICLSTNTNSHYNRGGSMQYGIFASNNEFSWRRCVTHG